MRNNFIEKIEILKGAGSSLYGSDAVGGVINIITKSAYKNYAKININCQYWSRWLIIESHGCNAFFDSNILT